MIGVDLIMQVLEEKPLSLDWGFSICYFFFGGNPFGGAPFPPFAGTTGFLAICFLLSSHKTVVN